MRTNIISFLALGALLILGSCSGGTSDPVTQDESIESNLESQNFLDTIPERYTQYEGFTTCSQDAINQCEDDENCAARGVDQCMMEAAGFTGDRSAVACDEFVSVESRESCQFSAVFSQAIQAKDPAVCDTLSADNLARCTGEVTMVLAVQAGDISACDTLQDADKVRCNNRVVMQQAISSQNVDLCDEILNTDMQDLMEDNLETTDTQDIPNFERDMCREQVSMFAEQELQIAE